MFGCRADWSLVKEHAAACMTSRHSHPGRGMTWPGRSMRTLHRTGRARPNRCDAGVLDIEQFDNFGKVGHAACQPSHFVDDHDIDLVCMDAPPLRLERAIVTPFLRRPVRCARALCGCQSVALVRSDSVAPSFRDSSLNTISALVGTSVVVGSFFVIVMVSALVVRAGNVRLFHCLHGHRIIDDLMQTAVHGLVATRAPMLLFDTKSGLIEKREQDIQKIRRSRVRAQRDRTKRRSVLVKGYFCSHL